MLIIKHRINTIKKLKKTPNNFGVEIDLRSNKKNIYLNHNPYEGGEPLVKWIKHYKHKLIVLNVKEEGLEEEIIRILNRNNIKKFFFHDQTFSSLLKNMKKTKVSVRYSEYENLRKVNFLFKRIKWVWVDNFNKIILEKKFYREIKKNNVKICLVSPEVVNIKRMKEIKKVISFLKKNNLYIDAVCTKKPFLWSRLIS